MVVKDDVYVGETQVHTPDTPPDVGEGSWTSVTFDASKWPNATRRESSAAPQGALTSSSVYPGISAIAGTTPRPPRGVTRISNSVLVYDFGFNVAGVSVLELSANARSRCHEIPSGCNLTLVHSEQLLANGSVAMMYTRAPMIANYVISSAKNHARASSTSNLTLTPRFTHFGFQYVELRGWPKDLATPLLTQVAISTAVEATGHIEFHGHKHAAKLLQKIESCTRASALSNLISVPTDCPTRERRGYLGDGHVAAPTLVKGWDMRGMYTKWLRDIGDAQVAVNESRKSEGTGALPCKVRGVCVWAYLPR